MQVRDILRSRENGKWHDEADWWQFGRNQNISEMPEPKILTQVLARSANFTLDEAGEFAFVGGGNAGGYGVILDSVNHARTKLVLAELNSSVLDWYVKQISTTFRGGFFSFARRYIEKLPIAVASQEHESLVVQYVDYLLWLNRYFRERADVKTARDALMLGYWEQVLNGLVYELYFTEELHERNLHLFDLVEETGLPALETIPETERLSRLREEFERVYDLQHPLRAALHELQTVEEVRIIEGKA